MVKTPQLWSTDCPQKRVKVEVRYPEDGDYTWVEIPTAQVELHETKEGTPDHHRTAKVVFPTEWGDVSGDDPLGLLNNVREIVDPVVKQDIIMARVSFKNDNNEYVLKHVGFVGGVGNVNVLESKFWIYDFATMCQSVPFSESYNRDDTVEQVLSNIASAIEEDTPVPLKGVVIQDGGTSFEYEDLPSQFTDAVNYHNRWIDTITFVQEQTATDQFTYNYESRELSTDESNVGESLATLPIFTGDSIFVYGKQFQSNRHTIVDALEWVSEKTGAMWQFQPTIDGEGVTLLVSLLPHRYTFIQDEVLDGVQNDTVSIPNSEDYTVFDDIRVLNNTALEQINPYNTVEIRGAKAVLDVGEADEDVVFVNEDVDEAVEEFFGQTQASSDIYPYVKVRNEPLYQAAGQTELSKRYDSDASTIKQARGEAQRRLRELLNNPTEGSIELKGNPFVTPYDRIDAFEVCGDFVETQPQPVAYEVHTVTHTQRYGRQYECSVDASIYTGEDVATEVIAQMEEI